MANTNNTNSNANDDFVERQELKELHLACCPRMTEGNFPGYEVYKADCSVPFLANFRRLARLMPDREVIHSRSGFSNQKEFINKKEYDLNITYHEAYLIVNVMGTLLRETFGLGKGDHIGIICRNSPFWLLFELAVNSIGGILVPLYDTLGPQKLAYCSDLANVKAIFTQEANFGICFAAASKVESIRYIVCVDGIKDIVMEFPEFFFEGVIGTEKKKISDNYLNGRKFVDRDVDKILRELLKTAVPVFAKHFYSGTADVNAFQNTLSDDAASMYSINFSSAGTGSASVAGSELADENVTSPADFCQDVLDQMPKFDINNFKGVKTEDRLHIYYLHPLFSHLLEELKVKIASQKLSIYKLLLDYEDEKVEMTDNTKIIFTSGSSGPPKGVVHTYKSLIHGSAATFYRLAPITKDCMCELTTEKINELQILSHEIAQNRSILYNSQHERYTEIYEKFCKFNRIIGQDSNKGLEHLRGYFFMPLAHCYDAAVELGALCCHPMSIYYVCISAGSLLADLGMVKPHLLTGVPRVFTKLSAGIDKKLAETSPVVRKAFKLACDLKYKAMKYSNKVNITGKFPVLDKTVLKSVVRLLGGNLKVIVSGSAAIPNETVKLLKAVSCSCVLQGFGMSESAAGGSVSPSNQCYNESVTLGPMGVASPGLLIKIVDRSDICEFNLERDRIGELCTKGPCMASHYLGKTEPLFDKDGWYHTGDLVRVYTTNEKISLNGKTKKSLRNKYLLRPLTNLQKDLADPIKVDIDFSAGSQYTEADKINFEGFDPCYEDERRKNNLEKISTEEKQRLITLYQEELRQRHRNTKYDEKKMIYSYDVDNLIFVRRAAAVVKTQCGEFLDLELIENSMENSPLFSLASVYATADKTFPVAVVSVDSNVLLAKLNALRKENEEKLCLNDIIEYKVDGKIISKEEANASMSNTKDMEEIGKFKRTCIFIKQEYRVMVREILTNESSSFIKRAGLNGFCCPKTFHVTFDDDWNDPVLLTATMKKQRKGINKYFGSIIESLIKELSEVDQKGGSIQISKEITGEKHEGNYFGNKWVLCSLGIVSAVVVRAIVKAFLRK